MLNPHDISIYRHRYIKTSKDCFLMNLGCCKLSRHVTLGLAQLVVTVSRLQQWCTLTMAMSVIVGNRQPLAEGSVAIGCPWTLHIWVSVPKCCGPFFAPKCQHDANNHKGAKIKKKHAPYIIIAIKTASNGFGWKSQRLLTSNMHVYLEDSI